MRRGLRHATLVGRVALWLAAAVLGLLPYLYLPLAAARRPYHAWGDPETWSRFIDHVSGRAIQLGFPDQFLSLSGPRVSWAMGELTGQLVLDFGPLLLIAPLGLIALLRRHGGLGRLLVLLLVVDAAYAVLINPMGLTDRQNGLVTYCVVALTTAVGLGALIRQMMRRWSGSRGRQVAVGALLVTTTAICLLGADRRVLLQNGSWGAEDLVFEALQRAAEGALVLTSSDALAAARLYVVGLGALRPDLQALDRSELSDSRLLLERHRTGPFPLAPDHEAARWAQWGPGVTRDTYLQRIDALTEQALTAGREVLWEGGSATDSEGRWEGIIPTFPLHHIVPDTGLPAHLLPHAVQLVPDDPALERDPWGRRWLGHYLNYLGTYDVRRGRLDLAEEAFMLAHRTAPELAPPLVNLGVLAARAGDFAQASALAERATRLDPLDTRAWLNLARYRCALEHASDAEYAARRATTLGAPIEGDWMCW